MKDWIEWNDVGEFNVWVSLSLVSLSKRAELVGKAQWEENKIADCVYCHLYPPLKETSAKSLSMCKLCE